MNAVATKGITMIKAILKKIDRWIVARFEPSLLDKQTDPTSQVSVAASTAVSLFF